MGEISPPTAADYAWGAANTAQKKADRNAAENQSLRERVARLEQDVQALVVILSRLSASSGVAQDAVRALKRELPTAEQEAMRQRVRDSRG